MNNFGFNNLNNDNPLSQYLKQFMSHNQQSDEPPLQKMANAQNCNYSGIKVFEIMTKDDLTYIKPDNTGQKQIIICDSEKAIYIARYNYATGKPDYEKFISEGTIELFKKNDSNVDMTQITEALVMVANKLDSMHNEIQEIKKVEPKKDETKRRSSGQKKKD